MKKPKNNVKTTEVYGCPRCKINSEGTQMCPCPRGSCEAELIGTKTVRTTYAFTEKKTSK